MKLKKLLSIFLVGVLAVSGFCYPLSAIAAEDYSYKIDKALAEKLEKMDDNDEIPVSVWLEDIDHEAVKAQALARIKGKVSDDVYEIAKADGNTSEILRINEKETKKSIEQQKKDSLEIQKYIVEKRKVSAQMQIKKNQLIIKNNLDDVSSLQYNSKYTPSVEITLKKSQILSLVRSNEIDNIYLSNMSTQIGYEIKANDSDDPEDPDFQNTYLKCFEATKLSWTRDVWGLTGYGVNVGVFDVGFDEVNDSNYFANNNNVSYLIYDNVSTQKEKYKKHGSMVACIIGGKELSSDGSVTYKGAVPNASLYMTAGYWYKYSYEQLLTQGCNVMNTSRDVTEDEGSYNDYAQCAKWIDHIATYHNAHFVIAAGNSGSDGIIPGGMAYNALTVGNCYNTGVLHPSSSYYYNNDYPNKCLYKPDLVAPGYNIVTPIQTATGTSLSAPMVTSAVAQFCQLSAVLRTNPTLMKALVLSGTNRTPDMISSAVGSNINSVSWAVSRSVGCGMLSTLNMFVSFHDKSQYIPLSFTSGTGNVITKTKTIQVKANHNYQLRAALTWDKFNTLSGTTHTSSDVSSPNLNTFAFRITTPSGNYYKTVGADDNKALLSFHTTESGVYQFKVSRIQINNTDLDCSISYSLNDE